MAYQLTLSRNERRAIDWVGFRDWNGDALYELLWAESSQVPDDADWDDERDITFNIPEHVAWEMRDLYETSDGGIVPHFNDALSVKIMRFMEGIV